MNLLKKISFVLFAILVIMPAVAQKESKKKKKNEPVPAPAPPPFSLKNKSDSVNYAIGVSICQMLQSQGLDSINAEVFSKGLTDFYNKKPTLISAEQAGPLLQQHFQMLYMKKMEAVKEEGIKCLETNKAKPGVVVLPSGLQYQVISTGTGPKPKVTDRVKVHYTGTLPDGKKFDSSVDRNEPAVFGVDQVIPGWTEALQLMNVGSKWKLVIPSELAYGERGAGNGQIPPNSVLLFDVELLGIEK
jgi:FKBP-type peptidyl-prolyl cis-trans isomerase FklB